MSRKKYSVILRALAIVMTIAVVVPVNAGAAVAETVQPLASNYIQSANASISAAAGGKIQVWYDIVGVGIQDSLGVVKIQIFRSANNSSWSLQKTFSYQDYPELLSSNDNYHSGSIEIQGTVGVYYKAYVSFYGGSDGDGNYRYCYTSSVRAVSSPS